MPGCMGSSTVNVPGLEQKWKPAIAVHTAAPATHCTTPSLGRPTLHVAVPVPDTNRVGLAHCMGWMLSIVPSQLSSRLLHVSSVGPTEVQVTRPNASQAVTVPLLQRPTCPPTVQGVPIGGHGTLHTPSRNVSPEQH